MLNFCDFIQAFVFTTNHHLNIETMELPTVVLNSLAEFSPPDVTDTNVNI